MAWQIEPQPLLALITPFWTGFRTSHEEQRIRNAYLFLIYPLPHLKMGFTTNLRYRAFLGNRVDMISGLCIGLFILASILKTLYVGVGHHEQGGCRESMDGLSRACEFICQDTRNNADA